MGRCLAGPARAQIGRRGRPEPPQPPGGRGALRDAVALTRPGQELGPAEESTPPPNALRPGDPFRARRLAAVAADLMTPLDVERAGELAGKLKDVGARSRPTPVAATQLRADAEPVALFCTDILLGKAVNRRRVDVYNCQHVGLAATPNAS